MMTKERLRELRDIAIADMATGDETDSTDHVLELIAEVERLQAELGRQTTYVHELEEAMDTDRLLKIQTAQWRNFVPHVGPPDTTPCVQVPLGPGGCTCGHLNCPTCCGQQGPKADARDGGL
jgi:hypothetical protein